MYETITPQTPYLVLKLVHLCVKVRLMAMPVQSVDHLVYRLFSLKTIQLKLVQADRPFDLAALNLVLICKTRPVKSTDH